MLQNDLNISFSNSSDRINCFNLYLDDPTTQPNAIVRSYDDILSRQPPSCTTMRKPFITLIRGECAFADSTIEIKSEGVTESINFISSTLFRLIAYTREDKVHHRARPSGTSGCGRKVWVC